MWTSIFAWKIIIDIYDNYAKDFLVDRQKKGTCVLL